MQGDDDSVVVAQHEEKCAEGFVCLFGFVSGVLAIVLIRFVADHMFGGRYAKPPVIHVEVTGRPVGLRRRVGRRLELLGDTVGAGGIGRSLRASLGSFGSKDCDRQGGRPESAGIWICAPGTACAMLTTLRGEAHGEAELGTIQRGGAPLRW